jgi:hypothetical protein
MPVNRMSPVRMYSLGRLPLLLSKQVSDEPNTPLFPISIKTRDCSNLRLTRGMLTNIGLDSKHKHLHSSLLHNRYPSYRRYLTTMCTVVKIQTPSPSAVTILGRIQNIQACPMHSPYVKAFNSSLYLHCQIVFEQYSLTQHSTRSSQSVSMLSISQMTILYWHHRREVARL